MRDSRRVKAILASASIFAVCGVANAVTDTWVGSIAPTNGLTYPANTAQWDKTTANWNNGGTNLYTPLVDNVVFTDNFSGFTNVALSGTMDPNSIEFAHIVGSTPVNYVFLVSGTMSTLGDTGTSSSPWQGGITAPPTLTIDPGFRGSIDLQGRTTSAADGGATFINSGTLIIEDAGALIPYGSNNNPNVTIGSGGTLEININDTVIGGSNTQPSSSQLAGNLNVISSSTLALGAANNSRMWNGTINLSPGATLFMNSIVASTDEMDLAARIQGPGTISLGSSSSVLRLDSANGGNVGVTYDTGTGTAVLRNDLANGGTMNLGALTGGSGTFLDGSEAAATAATTYSIGALASSTFNGTIRDEASNAATVSITKVGATTLTLTNSGNSYSGLTTVNNGTLLSTAPGGTPFGVGQITSNGGVLAVAPSGTGSAITDTADTLGPGTQFTYAGGGTLALNKGTQNSVTFLVGNSAPTAGTLLVSRTSQGTLVIAPAGGTVATNLGMNENFLVNSTTAGNVPVVTNGIVNTSIVGQNNDAGLSGDFLNYDNTKGFILAAYTDTNFATPLATSVELVNAPQSSLASTNVFALNASANIAVGAGNTLTIGNPGAGAGQSNQAGLILNGASISGSTSTLTFGSAEGTVYTSAANGSISTAITGAGLVTFFGPGTLTVSGNDSDTGTHNINSGKVILTGDNSAATGATNVNQNATLQLQANSGNTTGGINTALSQTAAQLQLLNNSTVQLRADAPTTFYNNANGISMNSRSVTFDVNQLTGAGTNNQLTFAPAGFTENGATINVTGGNGYSLALGLITASSNSVETLDPTTATLTIPGFTSSSASAGTATLDLDGTNAGNTVTGAITNNASVTGANVAVTKSNTSTWSLSGANTYSGTTAINGGVLSLNSAGAIPAGGSITFGGGTLQFTSNNTNDYSAKMLLTDAVTAVIDTNGQSVTFASPFQVGTVKAGALTKIGLGTLTLSAANTYTGVTTVSNGELSVANSSGSATGTGNVVLNGGILASTVAGTITGNVLAGTGSHTIAPGGVGTIGALTIGGLTSTSLTNLNFDLGNAVAPEITNGDLLTLGTGIVNIGAGTLMSFAGPTTIGDDYRLIGDGSSGTVVDAITLTNFSLPTAPAGQAFSLSNSVDAGFIDLVVAAAGPVPLSWNNTGANVPSDGRTWDINNNKNWNSGSAGVNVVYTDGSNVTFNDTNNITPGGTNANAYNVTLNTLVSPASVTVNTTGTYSITGTGTIGGTGSLTKSGTGTLSLATPNTYSGGTVVTMGKLLIGQAGTNATFSGPTLITANTLTALPTGTLSVSGNGIAQLADGVTNQTFVTPGAHSAVVTSNINLSSLSLTGSGTLDLGNNRILIDYTTGNDPIASIKQWIANGFSDGETAGALPAIISSDVAADDSASGLSYGIGYADGADGAIAGLPSGEIEIMFTLLGDANLDGTVNSEDFTPFSNNLNGSNRSWDQGDFNYDGTVNSEDFTPFSHDLNQSDSLAASQGGVLLSPLVSAGGLSLTNVPEPASIGLVAIAGCSLLARRRRSSR